MTDTTINLINQMDSELRILSNFIYNWCEAINTKGSDWDE